MTKPCYSCGKPTEGLLTWQWRADGWFDGHVRDNAHGNVPYCPTCIETLTKKSSWLP